MSLSSLLTALSSLPEAQNYYVPNIWTSDKTSESLVSAPEYFSNLIDGILKTPSTPITASTDGAWTAEAVIYNIFVRLTTAYDHNADGHIALEPLESGFRETGTFLKTIALLPYIKKMGVNTIHLLPITSIGHDGNKGTLGSPYAIKNPYKIDDNLAEPALNLDVDTEFKAFVEAAHHLGIRVVVEFVFRTISKDGDWIEERPDWVYWLDNCVENRLPGTQDDTRYGNPIFSRDDLENIYNKVNESDFNALPKPVARYQEMFVDPPQTVEKQSGKFIGSSPDGKTCRIPGAFADWPPDDIQPPWDDVTYLKMYTHPDYNYIAYNTIRMYDEEITHSGTENQDLWERIIGILPHYQQDFEIDGVMIDMGHALPFDLKKKMVAASRAINPDFAFWDENFDVSEKSLKEGYNAVVGSLIFVGHKPTELKSYLSYLNSIGVAVPFFGTAENHNCPRNMFRYSNGQEAYRYTKFIWGVICMLPCIPFIHSGMEICETYPINTGLDFSQDELRLFPSEKLPLFSEYAFNWKEINQFQHLGPFLKQLIDIRQNYHGLLSNTDKDFVDIRDCNNPQFLCLVRKGKETSLMFIGNLDFRNEHFDNVEVDTSKKFIQDIVTKKPFQLTDKKIFIGVG
jgi:glycosidase